MDFNRRNTAMAGDYTMPTCSCGISVEINNISSLFLSCAPCPPPEFGYEDFVLFAENQNLSSCEIEEIATKCSLEPNIPLEMLTVETPVNGTDEIFPTRTMQRDPKQIEPWVIVVTVVSCVVFIIHFLLVAALVRNRQRAWKRGKEAGSPPTSVDNEKQGILNAAFTGLQRHNEQQGTNISINNPGDLEVNGGPPQENTADVDLYILQTGGTRGRNTNTFHEKDCTISEVGVTNSDQDHVTCHPSETEDIGIGLGMLHTNVATDSDMFGYNSGVRGYLKGPEKEALDITEGTNVYNDAKIPED